MPSSKPLEEFEHAGLRVRIHLDHDPSPPDNGPENGGYNIFLVAFHRQFSVKKDGFDQETCREIFRNRNQHDDYWVFSLYAYIHSGVSLHLSRGEASQFDPGGWDTSHLGLVFADKLQWPEEEKAREAAESLVKEWNTYLSGDIYGVSVGYADTDDEEGHWGIHGLDAARDYGKANAESMAKYIAELQGKEQGFGNDPRPLPSNHDGADCAGEEADEER
jgi:hypothetical protein